MNPSGPIPVLPGKPLAPPAPPTSRPWPPQTMELEQQTQRAGLGYALAAFGFWGFVFPLMMVALNATEGGNAATSSRIDWALEISAHRIVWSLVVCLLLVWLHPSGMVRSFTQTLRSPAIGWYALSAVLIATNWAAFVFGATTDRLSQASFGYYINPLWSVALGMIFLGERLRWQRLVAVGLAAAGVAWETVVQGEIPMIALAVAFSFGLYGLIRKQTAAPPVVGFALETVILAPLAIGYLAWRWVAGPPLSFGSNVPVTLLLMASGIATTAPLVWFASAARRLPLSTLGFMQYITPTGQLLVALLANGESLSLGSLGAFAMIWLGIAVFLVTRDSG